MINWSILFRSTVPPLLVWGVLVAVVTLSGQPGVVCITPMAWLLALWCGTHYMLLAGGQPGRRPFLGPALGGALIGACEGVLFALVVGRAMPSATPEDVSKAQVLTWIVFGAGILICAGLSAFTALLTLKRLSRQS